MVVQLYTVKNPSVSGRHPLCFGIVKNHPFLDGNKRTGLLSAHALLFLNGQVFEPAEVDEVTMMVGVADGTVDEALLASWLARFSTRRA